MILYVETHWVMGCVLHQDAGAARLMDGSDDQYRVAMPAFCVAEAIARFRTLEKDAREFRTRLEQSRHEATRMNLKAAASLATALETATREQDLLLATLPTQLSSFMARLFASPVEQVPIDDEIVRRSNDYIDDLQLSRGDALVLATIVQHASKHPGSQQRVGFLSGNTKDFGSGTPAREELRRVGITFFSKTAAASGWMISKRSQ